MNLGISTACFYPTVTEKAFECCIKSGSECCEVFFNAYSELSPGFLKELKTQATLGGVSIVSVHPFTSIDEPYMLFSRYERRFEDGRDFYKRYYEAANMLGADILVIHGGRPGAHTSDEVYCERFSILREDARAFGVRVAQENVNAYKSGSPDFIRKMRSLMKDDIDFVFDVKQAVRAGFSPEDMLNAMGDRLIHLHLSDHTGSNDCLLPGKGSYNFAVLAKYLDDINYTGSGVIEVYSNAFERTEEVKNSLLYLKDGMKV